MMMMLLLLLLAAFDVGRTRIIPPPPTPTTTSVLVSDHPSPKGFQESASGMDPKRRGGAAATPRSRSAMGTASRTCHASSGPLSLGADSTLVGWLSSPAVERTCPHEKKGWGAIVLDDNALSGSIPVEFRLPSSLVGAALNDKRQADSPTPSPRSSGAFGPSSTSRKSSPVPFPPSAGGSRASSVCRCQGNVLAVSLPSGTRQLEPAPLWYLRKHRRWNGPGATAHGPYRGPNISINCDRVECECECMCASNASDATATKRVGSGACWRSHPMPLFPLVGY
jgi:hypothetical protein